MTLKNNCDYLYLHVPFCNNICGYCDFVRTINNESLVDKWLEALKIEIDSNNINPNLNTIYIGGGTPSCLSIDQLEKLFLYLSPYLSNVKEYTIEINPESITIDKLELMKKYGINRISVGYQSNDDKMLSFLGRKHTYLDTVKAINNIKEVGINNISLDIIYGLPNQNMADLKSCIHDALILKPTHISLYSLQIEENSIFYKNGISNIDAELEADMYEYIRNVLADNDYLQYEISNFSKYGYESIHNKAYWNYEDYYGISCGASGKENHRRYDKTNNIYSYIENPLERDYIELNREDEIFEYIMMGLRKVEGINIKSFYETFNINIFDIYKEIIDKHINNGNIIVNDNIACSYKGLAILNEILIDFF